MGDKASRMESGPETAAPKAETRSARTLGRGLEDLSPLFLSGRRPEAPAPPAAPAAPVGAETSQRDRAAARHRSGTLLLRPTAALTRDQVVAAIQASPDAVETRLRAIDYGVPGGPDGPIDVLAFDGAGRLVVVDVDLAATGSLLVRGLDHAEWISRNLAVVRRMCPDRSVDFSERPRLILVAHDFSRALRNAVRQIAVPEVTCVRCHGLDVSGWTGIFFERIADDDF